RYYDPSPHLRIRLKTDNQRINEISNILLKILNEDLNNSLINDISINTYKRELTRYKYNLIKLSELLFNYDSDSIMGIISILAEVSDSSENIRAKIALLNVDSWFNDFGFDNNEKLEIINNLYFSFREEFVDHFDRETSIKFLE